LKNETKCERKLPALVRSLFILCVFLLLNSSCLAENLLENGSFEELDRNGMPIGWNRDAYHMDEGYTLFAVDEEDSTDGSYSVSIQNVGENDARYSQTVSVEPESLYCFSGFIRTENVESGHGANLSIEGLYTFSECVHDTSDGWKYIEWYGETGPEQTSVTLYARLGGYSGESTGKAWFDDLSLEKVDEYPGDEAASLWYREQVISYFDEDADDDQESSGASPAWPRLIMLALGWSLIALLVIQWLRRRKKDLQEGNHSGAALFAAGLGFAFLLRMIIAYFVIGYMVDVNCFTSWGNTMLKYGPAGFYPETNFCDYPPAYTYVLGLNALICRAFPEINPGMSRIVHRFIPCLCDIISCILLDRFFARREKTISSFARRIVLLLLAFHPVLILNSAAWGQMDSAFTLLLILVAIWALEGKWELSLPSYMLAVLVKPQALMLGFLGLLAIIIAWKKKWESRRKIIIGIGASFAVLLIIVVPFSLRQDPLWIINQYAGTLASYPYASVNTANFYYLLGGNWKPITAEAPFIASVVLGCLTAAYGAVFYMEGKNRHKYCQIEAALSGVFSAGFFLGAFLHVSWSQIGAASMVFAFVIVLSLYIRRGEITLLPYLGGLLFLLLYVFGVKMHERYIFPAFLFFGFAYGLHRDRRILTVLLLLTCTSFINEGIVLDNSIRLGSSMGHLNQDTHVLAMILSSLNILITVYAVWIGLKICLAQEIETTVQTSILKDTAQGNGLNWKRRDSLILTAIVIVYSLICFSTLGSARAPQTAWTSTELTENVVLDLGEKIDSFSMLYFSRVSKYDFSVAVSDNGTDWQDETWAQMDQGQCWKWKYVTDSVALADESRTYGSTRHWFSGRDIRITAHQINLALCEVLFRDPQGQILKVISARRYEGNPDSSLYSNPEFLIDEQDTFEGLPVIFASEAARTDGEENPAVPQPSWWNSTYFDEIYHARTAWEFLNESVPYETSHPPLGKILMSWGVALFGMTPFGWRFAGALAGVLMLVFVYLLAMQMTKRTALAAFACGLMSLDCMHLTQTQIATIDSFPVLFILISYFFMLRFIQTDWRSETWRRILTDLGLCGVSMGLAIASKWIGIYAGAGLAVLFFWHVVRIFLSPKTVRSIQNENDDIKAGQKSNEVFKRFTCICLWCILFFVAIPVLIYLLSYIPYFAYRHFTDLGDYLQAVLNSQQGMLNYHSTPGLGMDHPFYSPWYEWPVIGKPMFYSTKQYIFNDDLSFSIFSFGNPVIWWGGIPALILCVWRWIRNREENIDLLSSKGIFASLDTNHIFILIGFLAQYLPWTLVPRGTYIYHYFASVPFLIFGFLMSAEQAELHSCRTGRLLRLMVLAAAAGFFVLLFPYASGILAPVSWLDAGKGLLKIWY